MTNSTPLEQFVASMPSRYGKVFGELEIQQHARIVGGRGGRAAHVRECSAMRHLGTGICIVATDRPGLLASISAALAMVGFSVNEAEIFTRQLSPSLSEAVDFFWVTRRAPMQNLPIGATDVRRLEQCLVDLLEDAEIALPERASAIIQAASESSTRIRFIVDPAQHFTSLEIDTDDRPGLLLAICQTLFAADLQIIGSHVKTVDGRARGRFDVVELDERPLAGDRRQELQMLVLSAIDELGRAVILSAGG